MSLLGIEIDNLERSEIVQKLKEYLKSSDFHQVVTVNPEFILLAQENRRFFNVLQEADLKVADGFGIKLALGWQRERLKTRWTGADLMEDILSLANRKNRKVFLLANKKGLTSWQEVVQVLQKKYSRIIFQGKNEDPEETLSSKTLKIIEEFQPDILFCNYGAPQQEIVIHQLKNHPIKLVMGVGGSFDFIVGRIRRAPLWMRKIGLEWLYRFWQQPWRWKRIYRAVIVFPWKIINNKKS